MRTKNFRIYSCAILGLSQQYKDEQQQQAYYTYVNILGEKKNSNRINSENYFSSNVRGGILEVGTGTTPPTEDDYKLENKVDLRLSNQSVILSPPNLVIVGTFKNNTSEAVTITEVAYRLLNRRDELQDNNDFIVSRDLITPITIPADERRTIQYTIEF